MLSFSRSHPSSCGSLLPASSLKNSFPSKALIPALLLQGNIIGFSDGVCGWASFRRWCAELSVIAVGLAFIALAAQISIALPWTPVPVTGQTFGVALVGLLWGGRRAPLIVALYLFSGAMGAPVFAGGSSGLILGPTMGYLIGMLFSSAVVGFLADRGWTHSFRGALAACAIGSLVTFFWGLLVLSAFVPFSQLFWAGFWPFLPGDFIKTFLAASCARSVSMR